MSIVNKKSSVVFVTAFALAMLGAVVSPTKAQTLTTLASFNTTNGAAPYAGVIADASGNLYGTTGYGGANNLGTAFKLTAGANTLTTLATFNGTNGRLPYGGLTADASGNLYGTTAGGGANDLGTVYMIATGTNALTTLATFNSTNGASPQAAVIVDVSGNLYGTTQGGGSSNMGTVFKLGAGSNTPTTLATFTGIANGRFVPAGLIADGSGNLYGTTSQGGASDRGTAFKLETATNTLTTIATFNSINGAYPQASLCFDASGNLVGTSLGGANGAGTVFRIAAGSNTLTTLAALTGNTHGRNPYAGLIVDASGNFYGTTTQGGANNVGTVFKLNAGTNTLTTLVTFTGTNGAEPYAGLIADAAGNLYGTTRIGGAGNAGTIFKIEGSGFVVVPEPTTLSALAGAVMLGLCRRR
jgi:uncharacterized repeat protein (TIGR03803 family)